MRTTHEENLLILTKTYPSPSRKYRETSCVAATNDSGQLRRLFPIPFRLLDGDQQFARWEWITAKLIKSSDDHRPESHKIVEGSIRKTGQSISAGEKGWPQRMRWIEPHVLGSFELADSKRLDVGNTLTFVRPTKIIGLEIVNARKHDWTEDERRTLIQDGLFDSDSAKNRRQLEKIPFDFYYRYECATTTNISEHRHKIVDWEVAMLYRNCRRTHGGKWEEPFRRKLEQEFSDRDLVLMMGTIHRFPEQWLIVGLIYPPRRRVGQQSQGELNFDGASA